MINIERAHVVPGDANRTFSAFHDVNARRFLMKDYVHTVEVSGSGEGSVYRMYVDNGGSRGCVVEMTDFFDANRREMRVRMIDTGGVVPFADYRSRLVVQAAGNDRSIVVICSTFLPLGIRTDVAETVANENYDAVFRRLDQYVSGEIDD